MIIGRNWSEELIRGTVRWYFKEETFPIAKCAFFLKFQNFGILRNNLNSILKQHRNREGFFFNRGKALHLALQVGGEVRSTKFLTKNYPPILRPVLNAAECISQFFQRLLACIFDIQKTGSQSKTSSWRSIHSKLEPFRKSGIANFSPL